MTPILVDDELWQLIQPLLPRTTRRYRHPGRRRLNDREVLSGILFVRLRTRYERRADIHEPFLSLACSLICLRQLQSSLC
jgi:transposase